MKTFRKDLESKMQNPKFKIEYLQSKLLEAEKQVEERTNIAELLWQLLDDIDTAGDMFKPEITEHFKYVNKKHKQRHKYISSDGYKLTWPTLKD